MTTQERSSARQIWERAPYPATNADKLARAREIVAQTGDLPEGVFYEMTMGAEREGRAEFALALKALRPEGAREYAGGWR